MMPVSEFAVPGVPIPMDSIFSSFSPACSIAFRETFAISAHISSAGLGSMVFVVAFEIIS